MPHLRHLVALYSLIPALVAAQHVPDFRRPVWRSAESATYIGSIRELSDGRVIVVDAGDREIRLLSPAGATLGTIGRRGGGPQEFQMPVWALAMPGDSTYVNDRDQGRFLVIGPDGAAVRTVLWPQVDGDGLRDKVVTDGMGRILFQREAFPRPGMTTTPLMRWDPRSGSVDSVSTVRTQTVVRYTSTYEGHEVQATRALPYDAGEGWAAGPRGEIAIVDPEHYVVRWQFPNGSRVTGDPIPYTPIPVSAAEREYFLHGESPATQAHLTFPANKPAVNAFLTFISPAGELWLQRHGQKGDSTVTWDLIDQRGERIRSIQIPRDRMVIGFGRSTVYAVQTDTDELQWLEAYR